MYLLRWENIILQMDQEFIIDKSIYYELFVKAINISPIIRLQYMVFYLWCALIIDIFDNNSLSSRFVWKILLGVMI